MTYDGFMTRVYSPAMKFVREASLVRIPDEDRAALYEAMRQQLLPIPELRQLTVALPGFVPTVITFRSMGSAGIMTFGRDGTQVAGRELVGAAFILPGLSASDEQEVISRTSLGCDATGQPLPIPPSTYDKIRAETMRPLLAMTLWNVDTANDPSLLAIAQAIASVFLETCTG